MTLPFSGEKIIWTHNLTTSVSIRLLPGEGEDIFLQIGSPRQANEDKEEIRKNNNI